MSNVDYEYVDALTTGPVHRRGAGLNPGNRFEDVRLHVLGEELDRQWIERSESGASGPVRVQRQVYLDKTKRIINRVDRSSDVPFDYTVNPYRGCEHGCIYCFARTFHEYLGFSSGLDFETKLTAKPQAADLLRRELAAPGWRGEPIVMSASTDVYQSVDHKMQLTRQCLAVMADCDQPVSTMTKSTLVLRDTDLWAKLARVGAGAVTITLVTLDPDLAQRLEPRAATPSARLRIITELSRESVPVSLNVAPIIPGLTDTELPQILKAGAQAGAQSASWVMLRLPHQLKALFLDWLGRNVHPDRARKVESLIRQTRGGHLYQANIKRGRGHGPHARQIAQTFKVFARRYHLDGKSEPLSSAHFRRPALDGQMDLFNPTQPAPSLRR